MLVKFVVLVALLVAYVNSQTYTQGNYNPLPQNGNQLSSQFPQGAGGSYPNQNSQQFQQPPTSPPSYGQNYGNAQNTQFGARYQFSVQLSTPRSPSAVAHGVVQHQQQPRAQPLPRVFTSSAPNTELAPLATASPTFPPPQQPQVHQQTFTSYPQTQGNFFYPPVPPQFSGASEFQQPQQPGNFNPNSYNPYTNSTTQQQNREPPVVNFTFKEGTPPYYCAYGLPVPEYNTPRKRCIPWHPFCGIVFTCIVDV